MVASLVFLGFGIKACSFNSSSALTSGQATKVEKKVKYKKGRERISCQATFTYEVEDRSYTGSSTYTNPPTVGQSVSLYYNTKNPSDIYRGRPNAAAMLILSLVCGGIGGGLVYALKKEA